MDYTLEELCNMSELREEIFFPEMEDTTKSLKEVFLMMDYLDTDEVIDKLKEDEYYNQHETIMPWEEEGITQELYEAWEASLYPMELEEACTSKDFTGSKMFLVAKSCFINELGYDRYLNHAKKEGADYLSLPEYEKACLVWQREVNEHNWRIKMNTKDKTLENEIKALEDSIREDEVIETLDLLNKANKNALVSKIASDLFNEDLDVRESMIGAVAYIGAAEYIEDPDTYEEAFIEGITSCVYNVSLGLGQVAEGEEFLFEPNLTEFQVFKSTGKIVEGLKKLEYMNAKDQIGPKLLEILKLRKEALSPVLASEGIQDRKFGYAKNKISKLFIEAIEALESTEFTVDKEMLDLALKVNAKLPKNSDPEEYVLHGSMNMDPEKGYISEFKGDLRLRIYQAYCHGPNGQSSDRSRALQNLHGVSMDYDPDYAMQVILKEMEDMVTVSDKEDRKKLIKEVKTDPVTFVLRHYDKDAEGEVVKKPWSFVKAVWLYLAVSAYKQGCGKKPYIGMAFGKDAKCSGPQYGALLVGDAKLAAACGFSLTRVPDAYHIGIEELIRADISGLERGDVKKPYMGIFYGQGVGAYMDPNKLSIAVWTAIHGDEFAVPDEGEAEKFHKAITRSFGAKMVAVRNMFRSYKNKVEGKPKYKTPDGCVVEMNYKVQVNAMGQALGYEIPLYDINIQNNTETYKFINYKIKTKTTDSNDFIRNGFVNMIQGVDALIARLIIVHAKRLGAQHIVSIHDCFRVNIHDLKILDQAIINAYQDVFGFGENKKTKDLPLGTDILGLYFEGINKSLTQEHQKDAITVSQFFSSGRRRIQKINGIYLNELISRLGETYYFE